MERPEAGLDGSPTACACGRAAHFVAAEAVPEGSGAGDFDSRLTVINGPLAGGAAVGTQFFLGGVPDLAVGKGPACNVLLPGQLVSRVHAKLLRVDFGPSRWFVENNKSTNGLYVNGAPCDAHELVDGDVVRIGEYQLQYHSLGAAPAPAAPPAPTAKPQAAGRGTAVKKREGKLMPAARTADGEPCPSCRNRLPKGAAICTDCGIYVKTGRPLLISRDVDEDTLQVRAENTAIVLSWIFPTGFYPVASEAYGHRKPYAVWTIAAVTILASILYIFAGYAAPEGERAAGSNLMLWPSHAITFAGRGLLEVPYDELSERNAEQLEREYDALSEREQKAYLLSQMRGPGEQFHYYQLLTHALLHGGWLHLAGNMLFLIVFGTRVNALIGNVATAILYPALAVASGLAHLAYGTAGLPVPMLGASGAIMGLAGMYLVLFPLHRVFMLVWARWILIFLPLWWVLLRSVGIKVSWKVFAVRGVWVVLFYVSFDVLFTLLGRRDGTAHWAHLGGFAAGAVIALVLLVSRLVNSEGGDLLSVTLGKWSWPLLGRPATRRRGDFTPLPAAVSMSYPGQ